jgi:hypothetical protein
VDLASAASNIPVRPEDAGPQISLRHPRGHPPVSPSRAAIPLETISGAGRTSNREAGVTWASLGTEPSFLSNGFAAKMKGRPKAAVDKTGKADILPRIFRERRRADRPERGHQLSLFIRLQ